MEPSDENSVTSPPRNGGPHLDKQHSGDEHQNLGLGFQSTVDIHSDTGSVEDEEARYVKKFSEEFENLVLEENRSVRERLVDHEEGFEDEREGFNVRTDSEKLKDLILGGNQSESERWVDHEEGFEDEREGYNGNNRYRVGPDSEEFKDLNFGENRWEEERWVDPEEGFYDDREGYNGNNSYPVRHGSEELKDLILGKNRWERDRWVDREEGFERRGGFDDKGYNSNNTYPVRPDAEDCQYYMRNGSCKYGLSCKFNHPLKRRNQYPNAAKDNGGYPERSGQIECKYHMSPGGCKNGMACKYSHRGTKNPPTPAVEFNFLGLPIRPGETECPFYMRNGSCKYGSSCKYNHPEPSAVVGADSPSGYGHSGTVPFQAAPQTSSWSSPRALNGTGSVLPVVYSPTNAVPAPNQEWNSYQAPAYPAITERALPTPPAFTQHHPAGTNFYMHHRAPMVTDDFPERPGEPECSYFMKTGECKYRSGCRFHHPKNRVTNSGQCILSEKGLPLRPDQKVCSYYIRYGLCKFGPACRFDHPVEYNNSLSPTGSRQPPLFVGSDVVENRGFNERNASNVSGGW